MKMIAGLRRSLIVERFDKQDAIKNARVVAQPATELVPELIDNLAQLFQRRIARRADRAKSIKGETEGGCMFAPSPFQVPALMVVEGSVFLGAIHGLK